MRVRRLAVFGIGSFVACHATPPSPQPAPTPGSVMAPAPAPVPDAVASANEPFALVIDHSGTRLGTGTPVLIPLPADPSRGADARYKRSGPNDLYLTPLAEAFQRERQAGHLNDRLRIIVDPDTSYRVLVEALYTAGQNELGSYDLFESSALGRTISFDAPRFSGELNPSERRLNLVAIVVTDGIGLKASGGNVAPGCAGVGAGLTIPRRGGALDIAALKSCAEKLKASDPAFADERKVTIVGSAGTPVREIMDVALALQGPSKGLFPELLFAVPR